MANASAILAPTVAILPAPTPYFILITVSICGFLASNYLPAPGHHLPKIVVLPDSSTTEHGAAEAVLGEEKPGKVTGGSSAKQLPLEFSFLQHQPTSEQQQ